MPKAKQKRKKEKYRKNRMVMSYFGITLTSPKWMIKVKNLKTKGWPSGCAYMVVEVPAETFLPKDMFLKAEQNTKLGQLKYKKGQNPDNFGTAIGGLEVKYRNKFTKYYKIATLVSAVGRFYGETIINKMEKLEAAKGNDVTCDAIVEKLCKVYRATGSGKGVVADPNETELSGPGHDAKDKACHYCKEVGHVKDHCPKLARKRSKNKCEYPGCTMKVGYTTDRCWEDPKNEEDRPAN